MKWKILDKFWVEGLSNSEWRKWYKNRSHYRKEGRELILGNYLVDPFLVFLADIGKLECKVCGKKADFPDPCHGIRNVKPVGIELTPRSNDE